jgi:hypothetical protein
MTLNLRGCVAGLVRTLPRRRKSAARPSFLPQLLPLEDRALLSTLTVVNLHDAGAGSLRSVLAQAHSGDTVIFARDLRGTIILASGELQVCPGVTVKGPGAGRLSINANHASRVFEILAGDEAKLSGLTITGGLISVPDPGVPESRGGGIYVGQGASLMLTDSVVTGNTASITATIGQGGGICNLGTLTLKGDTIATNTANAGPGFNGIRGYGGGIYNEGTLTLQDSTVANNIANSTFGSTSNPDVAGFGGGIYTIGPSVTLTRVTLAGNIANSGSVVSGSFADAFGEGGGIDDVYGTLTVKNSVFSGNVANTGSGIATDPGGSSAEAVGWGGAIHAAGRATVTDSVFTNNAGNTGSGSAVPSFRVSVEGWGGAIYYDARADTLTIAGSIFRDNTANTGPATAIPGAGEIQAFGGAVYSHADLTVGRSLFTGNVANSADASGPIVALGGAIEAAAGPARVAGSTLANNTTNAGSTPAGIDAHGGALDYFDYSGLTLTGCNVIGNIVNAGGAAALTASGGGASILVGTVSDCVMADNVVNSGSGIGAVGLAGGGIDVRYSATVQGTLVLNNNVNTDAGSGQAAAGSYAVGGGIAVEDRAVLQLNRSIVTGNKNVAAPSDLGLLGSGQVDPASAHNVIGAGGSGGLVNGVNGNLVE